ncbi:MAG: hypothetical protein QOE51_1057 [Actinoplanes sp.]|jgi:hypothetical protein|nr:hypothetical protein [Actinoplanes sp.]
MRFFSNDARETTENDTERPDDPNAVPQQRTGSPWSDTRTDSTPQDAGTVPVEPDPNDPDGVPAATDEHDPDVDVPLDERDTATDAHVNESTVTSPDAPVNEPTDAEVAGSDEDPALRDEGDFDEPNAVDPVTDRPLGQSENAAETGDEDETENTAETGDETGDEDAAEDETGESDAEARTDVDDDADKLDVVESDSESTTYAGAAAAEDADTRHDDTVAEDPTPADTAETAPVVAAVPVPATAQAETPAASAAEAPAAVEDAPAKPGAVAEKPVEALFGADDAKAFQERWRDVQMRFVDSPKDAATEAAGLVDEAVDKLTASLKSQKDSLRSDSDDTEQLRAEVRAYRDILHKVLSL